MFKRFLRWLLAAIGLLTEGNPVPESTPVASPESDKLKAVLDAILEAAYELTAGRPILHYAIGVLDGAMDYLWPKLFPEASKLLAAKGIKVE